VSAVAWKLCPPPSSPLYPRARDLSRTTSMTRPLELALTFARLQNHTFTYDEPIKVESVTQAVCDLALRFGEGADEEEASMVRLAARCYLAALC
jgi:hypothetical protein